MGIKFIENLSEAFPLVGPKTHIPAENGRCSNRDSKRSCIHYIAVPEGRVHFAGEHTTLSHGWMQGAIESGIRVAVEVNDLPRS